MKPHKLFDLIERLSNPSLYEASVIPWGSPIVSFGDINNSKIATLGLNPSNREFVDEKGNELKGGQRRFHTLHSLGLDSWSEAKDEHMILIAELCDEYFFRNPYDGWFKRLDYIISGTSMSYYFPSGEACHLDLIPYATALKWAALGPQQQDMLLELTSDSLGLLLKSSSIKMIVLNGQTVVENLEKISGINLKRTHMPSWTLPRKSGEGVQGYSYAGTINKIGGVKLRNEILVLGYNHNIQSSFGVTSQVQTSIRNWVTRKAKDIFE
jgi:hypothetical protein